jgi:dual specificity phosphatase 12
MSHICDFIDRMLIPTTRSSGILIHSHQGVSRSPTIIVAYLMRKHQTSLRDELKKIEKHLKARPKENFIRQLRVWEKVGYQIWKDDAKTMPKKEYAAFLEERAMELKFKGLTGDEPCYPRSL